MSGRGQGVKGVKGCGLTLGVLTEMAGKPDVPERPALEYGSPLKFHFIGKNE